MSFGRVSKGEAGRRQGEIILTDSVAQQQGTCTWHFTDRTCPAEPVCFEVFTIYILSSRSRGEKPDIRKTRTRRDCNSKCCAIHLLLHTVLKTDQPEVAHTQGHLATSTEHKLFLVRGQGRVPGAKTLQAKKNQTLKCKERNNWIDDSLTETQVCNNVRIEHWKTHLLFLNSDHALSHHTNSYFYCSDRLRWSWISQERTTCQAAKPTHQCLPLTSKFTRISVTQAARMGLHCRFSLGLPRSATSYCTQVAVCWCCLLQSVSDVLFLLLPWLLCATEDWATLQFTHSTLWRTCLTLGTNTFHIWFSTTMTTEQSNALYVYNRHGNNLTKRVLNSYLRLRPSQLQGMSKPKLRDLHVTGEWRAQREGVFRLITKPIVQ